MDMTKYFIRGMAKEISFQRCQSKLWVCKSNIAESAEFVQKHESCQTNFKNSSDEIYFIHLLRKVEKLDPE